MAAQGYVETAALLGEIQPLERPVCDHEAAYRWYYIDARARDSFTATYQNRSGTSDHYVGPAGDFRNEPLVADMIEIFGVGKIPGLDREAEDWLAQHL